MSASYRRVLVAPWLEENPYQRLLYDALSADGVRVTGIQRLTLRCLMRMWATTDVVHLHWLEYLTFTHRVVGLKSRVGAIGRALRLLVILGLVRHSRLRLVWTVHNVLPHEPRLPRVDRALARAAIWAADDVIVHSSYAADKVRSVLGRPRTTTVALHGNYVGSYPPPPASVDELRAVRDIPPDAFVYLVFGHLRRYKRVEGAIAAFRAIQDAEARLIVAGAIEDDVLRAELEHTAGGDRRIRLEFGFVADDQVSALHAISDAAIFNYDEVFSSGALLLALSQGVPIVAPARGSAAEIADAPALVTFPPGGLTEALREIRAGNCRERRASARQAADANSWHLAARRVLTAYADAS